MNAQNAKDFLPLVQALADGKTIQVFDEDEWVDFTDVHFRSDWQYRVKPEPREWDCVTSEISGCLHDINAVSVGDRQVFRVREILP